MTIGRLVAAGAAIGLAAAIPPGLAALLFWIVFRTKNGAGPHPIAGQAEPEAG